MAIIDIKLRGPGEDSAWFIKWKFLALKICVLPVWNCTRDKVLFTWHILILIIVFVLFTVDLQIFFWKCKYGERGSEGAGGRHKEQAGLCFAFTLAMRYCSIRLFGGMYVIILVINVKIGIDYSNKINRNS